MGIATIRMDTTDLIDTMVITRVLRTIGTKGIEFTAITDIITTTATNL
jgi:hypothetical protein